MTHPSRLAATAIPVAPAAPTAPHPRRRYPQQHHRRDPVVSAPARVLRGGHLLFTIMFWAGLVTAVELWWLGMSPVAARADQLAEVGRLTGMIGGYALLAQVLLMSRVGWLERWVGAHKLTGWHRRLGAAVVILVLAHLMFIVAGYAALSEQGVLAQAWVMFDTYADIAAAFAAAALIGLLGLLGLRALRRRLPYELWYWLHLTSYLVLWLGYAHQFRYGREIAAGFGRWYWIGLHVFVLASLGWGRVVAPLWLNLRHRLRVLQVRPEPDGMVSVYITGRQLKRLNAFGGQFFRWRFLTAGRWWQSHPFSLSAAPNDRWLRLTVKAVGGYTRSLRQLRPGARVWVHGPLGAFTAAHRTQPKVFLIAAGSGIAPVRAVLEQTSPGAIVIYRAHDESRLLFTEELEDLAQQRHATVWYVLGSRHDDGPRRLLSPRGLRELIPDLADRDVYLCGPPSLVDALQQVLRRVGVAGRQIHRDPFHF